MNILVTGVAGFIGSHTARALIDDGHTVIGIDSLNMSYDRRMKLYRLWKVLETAGEDISDYYCSDDQDDAPSFCWQIPPAVECDSFHFRRGDLTNDHLIRWAFDRHDIDCVMHTAARAGVRQSVEDPVAYANDNVVATASLLEAISSQDNPPQMVMSSTSSVYSGHNPPFSEDMACGTPASPYAATKRGAEMLARSFCQYQDLDVTVLRYFTVYGPEGRPDMSVFRFIKWISEGNPIQLYGDGHQSRDFTYIDDIVAGNLAAIGERDGYNVYNLSGGNYEPVSIQEMIHLVEEELGKKAEIQIHPEAKADADTTRADLRHAENHLGWEPVVSFEEGISRTIGWHQDNRVFVKSIKV